jgi:transposase
MFVIFWEDLVMAKGYRPVRRDQPFLLPPDMREWLGEDHPVWLVITAVEDHLDTSAAHGVRRTGGAGTAGYDPDMLVMLLVWAYANGVTSSRRIEALCRTDVAFRVICGGQGPDHVTVARFRAAFPQLAEALFTQVLVLCARLGMGRLGVVALDGTKIAASASKSANRTEEGLRKLAAARVAEHAARDAAEDDLLGEGRRGDEVPPDAWHPRRRGERIAAALRELEDDRRAGEAEREAQAREYLQALEAGHPPRGAVPESVQVQAAQTRLEQTEAAQEAKVAAWQEQRAAEQQAGTRRGPGGMKPPLPPDKHAGVRRARAGLERAQARAAEAERKAADSKDASPAPARNITDPDSRLMPVRGGGFIQGYNAQNVTSQDGLITATRLTQDPADARWFEPMLRQAEDTAAVIGAHRPAAGPAGSGPGQDSSTIGLILADAGYCSEASLTAAGPDRLIAVGKHRDLEKAARGQQAAGPQRSGPATTAMRERLRTGDGIAAYRQRGHIAETPHGNIKHNMRFRQLTMRGKHKTAAEWTFACTVHNLFKAISAGRLTSQALAALAT